MGLVVFKILGIKFSIYQSFMVPSLLKFRDFKVTYKVEAMKFLEIKDSGFRGFKVSWNQIFEISRFKYC
jgi:hypothetical protein